MTRLWVFSTWVVLRLKIVEEKLLSVFGWFDLLVSLL